MKNKYRLLLEQSTPQSIKFDPQAQELARGYGYKCFPNFPQPQPYKDLKTGQTVLYREKSKTEHVFVFNDGHYEVRDTGDANGKVTKTDKWTCNNLMSRQNALLNPKIRGFVDALKQNNGVLEYGDATPEQLLAMQAVDLSQIASKKPEFVNLYKDTYLSPEMMNDAGWSEFVKPGNIILFFPLKTGGVQIQKGKTSIEQEQVLLSTHKWQKEKPTQGNFVEVDLSNQASIDAAAKTYKELQGYTAQQNFDTYGRMVPNIIYKPTISLAQGTQVASELDGLLQAVTTSTVGAGLKENCRKLLKRYVDIAKGTISLDKNYINSKLLPVVKYCTNEKYTPFLKNKEIQALKYGGKYPWGTAQEIGAQSTLQEEVILRKLISKNLNEIKFNKKKI